MIESTTEKPRATRDPACLADSSTQWFVDRAREAGSYTIEGIVAIGVFFLLVMLVVQLGFLVLARNAAATSVDAALRKAVTAGASDLTIQDGIERDVLAVVPGASGISVVVTSNVSSVRALLRFRWLPPGPDFVPVTVSIERVAVRVVPP